MEREGEPGQGRTPRPPQEAWAEAGAPGVLGVTEWSACAQRDQNEGPGHNHLLSPKARDNEQGTFA